MAGDGMVSPKTVAELSEAISSRDRIAVSGAWPFSCRDDANLSLADLTGITELQASDQVVTVLAGTHVSRLNEELAPYGLELPLRGPAFAAGYPDTLAAMLSYNLPHAHQARWGGWREWVLGLTVVLADGTVAKSGSRVVKSVAGYDSHKLMVGSEFSLTVPAEVTLRLTPTRAVEPPTLEIHSDREPVWLMRTARSDFARISAREDVVAADQATSTLWLASRPIQIDAGSWGRSLDGSGEWIPPRETRFNEAARAVFDPTGKFARAEAVVYAA